MGSAVSAGVRSPCRAHRVRSQAYAIPGPTITAVQRAENLLPLCSLAVGVAPQSFGPSLSGNFIKGHADNALMPPAAAHAAPASLILRPHARALEHAASTRSVPRRIPLRDQPSTLQRILGSIYNYPSPFFSRPFRPYYQKLIPLRRFSCIAVATMKAARGGSFICRVQLGK
jgi:hypothetical protein